MKRSMKYDLSYANSSHFNDIHDSKCTGFQKSARQKATRPQNR